ncbi:hypothetical protein PSET11_01130 [Arthrobacter ulcerisalmonis]|uniref:Uncharacterized protein n=1 Tax=Arthrobacter ulcerisalmonis TaxID=2483813 RepID=A0A3P5X6U8_9MICC|nr:hypothetical protein PSET11_01130 [Arthrobacter ulcerisalmonis]
MVRPTEEGSSVRAWADPKRKPSLKPSLRSRGREPQANYTILPAGRSLLVDLPGLEDDWEASESIADRIVKSRGAKRPEPA